MQLPKQHHNLEGEFIVDGLNIKIKTNDGTEGTFPLRPKSIVQFEQKFSKGFAKLLSEDQKLEHIYYLAWSTLS